MSAPIPLYEPRCFAAGDTVKWNRVLPDYPASAGWVLKYSIRGQTTVLVTATTDADGNSFDILIPSSTTSTLIPGLWFLSGIVTNAGTGEQYQIYGSKLTISQNQLASTGSYDPRSTARRLLDAVEAMLLGNASREEKSYEIRTGESSRRIEFMDRTELLRQRAKLQQEVAAEEAEEKLANGQRDGKKILVRFGPSADYRIPGQTFPNYPK